MSYLVYKINKAGYLVARKVFKVKYYKKGI